MENVSSHLKQHTLLSIGYNDDYCTWPSANKQMQLILKNEKRSGKVAVEEKNGTACGWIEKFNFQFAGF